MLKYLLHSQIFMLEIYYSVISNSVKDEVWISQALCAILGRSVCGQQSYIIQKCQKGWCWSKSKWTDDEKCKGKKKKGGIEGEKFA